MQTDIEQRNFYAVSIRLRGTNLDAAHVARVLGIEPNKGIKYHANSGGRPYLQLEGAWLIEEEGTSPFDIEVVLDKLFSQVEKRGIVLAEIKGVEHAYVAILIAATQNELGSTYVDMQLNPDLARRLANLGLAMHVEMAPLPSYCRLDDAF